MSTLTLVATVEASNVPPRIRVDITDTGTPAINSVSVVRTDGSGSTAPVRTYDGNPLPLLTSGSDRVGTLYDYEMPYGKPATYTVVGQSGASNTVTVTAASAWLVHPGVPSRSLPITIQSAGGRERMVQRGVFYPLGRSTPVVITDGRRKRGESSLSLFTSTDSDRVALDVLVDDASVLLLNVPAGNPWGIDTAYISVGNTQENRPSRMLVQPERIWELPYLIVDMPVGGSQSQYAWSDLMARFSTWQDLLNNTATWSAAQAPTS